MMNRSTILLSLALTGRAPAATAHDVTPTIVAQGDTTIAYIFPTSPQSFIPIRSLPSFLAMPGADLPPVATEVIYSVPLPASLVHATSDVDCRHFSGTVRVAGKDIFNLDRDGDGIGCEPEDR